MHDKGKGKQKLKLYYALLISTTIIHYYQHINI